MVFPMTGEPRGGPTTFAEPDENLGYAERAKRFYDNPPAAPGQPQFQYEGIGALPSMLGDIAHDAINNPEGIRHLYNAAEQQTRLADSINSNQLSVEEAYDRRIKMVKDATGVQLDNPERYRMTERERRQLNVQGVEPADVPTYQRKMFDAKTAELRDANPDKIDQLTFGDINEEAKALAKGAEGEYEEARKDTKLSTPGSLVAQFGGGFQGSLRDPMITGTMFAGPTTAAGKTVGARLLSAGWRQGLYNAGITALEQPAVQAWRSEIGVKSGVLPAVENVGMSFLFGAIPGAGFRLLHEIPGHLQPSVQRVLAGTPQTGDIEKAIEATAHIDAPPPPVKETPIVQFRRDAAEYERNLPPVQEGYTRLWRGNRPGEVGKNPSFTNDLPGIALPFRKSYGGELSYVDIPTGELQKYLQTSGVAPGAEFGLPPEIAAQAKIANRTEPAAQVPPVEIRAARLGADMDAAEQATKPPPPSPDIPPQLHDDLTQAALRHADDPSKPSPQAVAAVDAIEAWHGSPHDFQSFDLSKIGTGEGAQSYGHGLYFAERKSVAQSYQDNLGGRRYKVLTDDEHKALDATMIPILLRDHGADHQIKYYTDAIDGIKKQFVEQEKAGIPVDDFGQQTLEMYQQKLEGWKKLKTDASYVEGPLYKVRIHADREHMLDWDKPLSEQAPEIQAKLKDLGFHMGAADVELALRSKATDMGGADKVSAALKDAGIPGIKYLDQGSRADTHRIISHDGVFDLWGPPNNYLGTFKTEAEAKALIPSATSNFVIFDDKLIDITHKNDKPLHPVIQEVQQRITEAQPQSRAEAEVAAHEALEDIGNRHANVRTREELAQPTLPPPPPVEGVKPAPASSKDPLDKIPWSDADGNAKMVSAQTAARAGERETKFADIIRECK